MDALGLIIKVLSNLVVSFLISNTIIMKLFQLFFIILISIPAMGQRGEVPKKNPDNKLDLKVVFQEYTRTTTNRYGHVVHREEDEYLFLKVNNLYLKDGITGIDKRHFKNYLSACPKALDLGLDGLNTYKRSHFLKRVSSGVQLAALIGGAIYGLRWFKSKNNADRNIAIGTALGGYGLGYVIKLGSKRLEHRADRIIVSAFDRYAEECYSPDPNAPMTTPSAIENGVSNKDEGILLDLKSNNPKAGVFAIGPAAGVTHYDAPVLNYGLESSVFLKGFYLQASGYLSSLLFKDSEIDLDRQYGASASLSIPIIAGVRNSKKANLFLGNLSGMSSYVEEFGHKSYNSLAIDIGGNHYRQYSLNHPDINPYRVTSTLLRGGLSYSSFTEMSYGINDNRFSDKTRYAMAVQRVYVNILYNYQNEYEVVSSSILAKDPVLEDKIGYVAGLDILRGSISKFTSYKFGVEAGKYPVVNNTNQWGGRMTFGVNFYNINR